jgi:hypothetical protein
MQFTTRHWAEIEARIKSLIAKRGEAFIQARVARSDPVRNLIWIRELGDTPIPLIAFDYEVKVYDQTPDGTNYGSVGDPATYTTNVRTYITTVVTPLPGEIVLVARHLGSDRLPKCLGVVKGKGAF